MQRWHLTAGLAAIAVTGAFLAPRLIGHSPAEPVIEPVVEPVIEPVVVDPGLPTGHLTVAAQLDRQAILRGQDAERFLVITLRAPSDIGEAFRRPIDLGVVMDVSGSMQARGKISYAKKAATLLADSVESDDTYSLVTFNDEAHVVVPATSVSDPWPIHQAIDAIWEGGGTNLYGGLDKGATEVRQSLVDGQIGRIVLLSDGKANKGITDPEAMGRLVATLAGQGVTVSAVGLGEDYNEDLLQRLADLGGGTYDYVDDPKELVAAFSDELERSASVVARGTRVNIELPDGVEGIEVIGWDAEKTDKGFSVWMGDVYAGDARKVIARVRVKATDATSLTIATASVDYQDIIDSQQARSIARAEAETTFEVAAVEKSVNRDVAIEAVRAWGNDVLIQSTHAYTTGDKGGAAKLAEESQKILFDASQVYAAPVLAADAERSAAQAEVYDRYDAAAPEAKAAVKATKEYYNTQSRALAE